MLVRADAAAQQNFAGFHAEADRCRPNAAFRAQKMFVAPQDADATAADVPMEDDASASAAPAAGAAAAEAAPGPQPDSGATAMETEEVMVKKKRTKKVALTVVPHTLSPTEADVSVRMIQL